MRWLHIRFICLLSRIHGEVAKFAGNVAIYNYERAHNLSNKAKQKIREWSAE